MLAHLDVLLPLQIDPALRKRHVMQCFCKIMDAFDHGMTPRAQVLAHLDVLLPSLFDALGAPSERVVVEALAVQAAIAADDPQQFRTLMQELIDRRAPKAAAPNRSLYAE